MKCKVCKKRADIVYENKKYCQSCFFTVDLTKVPLLDRRTSISTPIRTNKV